MKAQTILWGVAAFAAAGLVVYAGKRGGAVTLTGDQQRLQGVQDLYGYEAGQRQVTQQMVAQNWADLRNGVFASQPDFWI